MARILLVDDDRMSRKMAEMVIGKLGYEITTVEGGQQCLDTLAQDKDFDIILLDVEMPGMNGIETLEKIRVQEKDLKAKVMFLSGAEEPEEVLSRTYLEPAGFVQKPFVPAKLKEKLESALGNQ